MDTTDNLGSTEDSTSQEMTSEATPVNDSTSQEMTSDTKEGLTTPQAYVPFSSGKEKLKFGEEERELTWEEMKHYASLGGGAFKKMQEAAALEKKAQGLIDQLVASAKENPEDLIRYLNPDFKGFQPTRQQAENITDQAEDAAQQAKARGQDPQAAYIKKVQELESKLASQEQMLGEYKSRFEEMDVQKARESINTEKTQALSKYPEIKGNKFAETYMMDMYKKALSNNMNVSIEDCAFMTAQELKAMNTQKTTQLTNKLTENRKIAPVGNIPSGGVKGTVRKEWTLSDVQKLARGEL